MRPSRTKASATVTPDLPPITTAPSSGVLAPDCEPAVGLVVLVDDCDTSVTVVFDELSVAVGPPVIPPPVLLVLVLLFSSTYAAGPPPASHPPAVPSAGRSDAVCMNGRRCARHFSAFCASELLGSSAHACLMAE